MKTLKLPTKLIVHVFCHASGLATALLAAGVISFTDTFHDFISGFNSFDPLVTFTNTGNIIPGADITMSKIHGGLPPLTARAEIGMTSMYVTMPQCENIILGLGHEDGHARILANFSLEDVAPGKVILLRDEGGMNADLEKFSPTLFPRVNFGDLVFMSRNRLPGLKQFKGEKALSVDPSMKSSHPKSTYTPPSPQKEPDLSTPNSYKS
jgi:hypothetical protein